MDLLKVTNLKKKFKSHFFSPPAEILKGLTFSVKKNTITGFLGVNGSGKTTTIKCILNLIYPDSGEVEIFGSKNLNNDIKRKIGFLPERPYFYEYLTGSEFLSFYADLSGIKKNKSKLVSDLLERVGLSTAKKKKIRHYSKGMLQRVGVAQALIHTPEFVILDEPMTGLDPDGRKELRQIIKEIATHGATVFFSSHLLHDIEMLCDEVVILKQGSLVYQGRVEELINKELFQYFISYSIQGEINKIYCKDLKEVQLKIDELRNKKNEIIEIQNNREESAEKIFLDLMR